MGVRLIGECDSCHRTCSDLIAKKRDWIGEPPRDWPQFKHYCRRCLEDPNPKRTMEPMMDFTLCGIGDAAGIMVQAWLVGLLILAVVAIPCLIIMLCRGH